MSQRFKRSLFAIILVASLLAVGLYSSRSESRTAAGAENKTGLNVPVVPMQSATPWVTKEYIYGVGQLVATVEPTRFLDVPESNQFYNEIQKIAQLEVTIGCGGNPGPNYCTGDNVYRGTMAVFICRALGYHNPDPPASGSGAPHFTDVPTSHPYYNFIEKIYSLGITQGCTATTYCPDSPVTHAQMAAFMTRACGDFNPNQQQSYPWRTPDFSDVPSSDPLYPMIQRYAGRGIWPGCNVPNSTNNFCPGNNVKRDEMAYILMRNFNFDTPTLPRTCPGY